MERKSASITLRTTASKKAKAQDAADRRGITLSEHIDEAVEFYSGLDNYAAECLMRMGETFKLPESLIMSNVLIRRLAELRALEVVAGPVEPDEFLITSQGPRAGKALYDRLFGQFKQDFTSDLAQFKRRRLESLSLVIKDSEPTAENIEDYIKEKAELEAWLEQNDSQIVRERVFNRRETLPRSFWVDPDKS